MPLLDKEHLAQWLYETTPRQGDVGRFTWEYLPDEGITGKHAYQAWADVLLASEKWQAREAVEVEAIFWLLRAYDSGHRHGWEEGPSSQETMTGIFTWLCNLGFDPNESTTPQFLPGIRARLASVRGTT